MEPEQKALTAKRDVILAQVKEELSTAETIKARNPSLGEVAEQLDKLTELARCFEAVQTAIEEVTPNLEEEFNNRLQFEEAYYRAKDLYAECLEDSESKAGAGNRQKSDDLWDAVRFIQETQQQILLMQCQNPPPLAPPAGSQVSNSDPQSVAEAQKEFIKPAEEEVSAFHTCAVVSCARCNKHHPTYHCEQFKAMDVSGRRRLARSQGLCFNCLMPSHTANKCTLKPSCRRAGCKQRHHAMLCLQLQQGQESGETRNQPPQQLEQTEEVSVNAGQANAIKHDPSSVALLPTMVNSGEKEDKSHQVRHLVGSGSQVSLITEASVKRFGMKCTNASLEVSKANGGIVGTTAGADTRVMPSRFNGGTKLTTQAYVLGGLMTALPNQRLGVANGQVKNQQRILVAQRFILGWMVAGKIWRPCQTRTLNMVLNVTQELDINRSLRLSWEDQEILGTKRLRASKVKFQRESNSKEQIVKEDIIGIKLRVDGCYATTTGVSRNNQDRQNTKGKQFLEKRLSLIEVCRQRSRVKRVLHNLRPERRSGSITPAELHSARI